MEDRENLDENLTFGEALEAVKRGTPIARNGWNGKGMYVYLNKGSIADSNLESKETIYPSETLIDGINLGLFENGDTNTITRMPNLNMRTVNNSVITGWSPSQTDVLAEDWWIVKSNN
jgi:hypothetical protein